MRGGSRTAATFKMEHFVIIDVAAVLVPPLIFDLLSRAHIEKHYFIEKHHIEKHKNTMVFNPCTKMYRQDNPMVLCILGSLYFNLF